MLTRFLPRLKPGVSALLTYETPTHSASPSEAGMIVCEHGHMFCAHHIPHNLFSREVVIAYFNKMEELTDDERTAIVNYIRTMDDKRYDYCTKCIDDAFTDRGNEQVITKTVYKNVYYKHDIAEDLPAEFCPICTLEIIRKNDMFRYLSALCGMTEEEIKTEIRNRFASYEEMRQWMATIEYQHVREE